jgi:glycosyltransferase involved in cell wall biosynthesis
MVCKPDITVIMPVFNGDKFVRNAIESILNQTHSDFKFMIIDDGSTDETPNILAEYARKDSRITVICQENAGITESLNRLVRIADGDFIARMDADDVSMPKRFERQVAKLIANPDYLAVGCWVRELFENNALNHEIIYPDKPDLLNRHLRKGINCYAHGSVMMRRAVFEELGLLYRFEEGEDFDLWLRLIERGRLGIVEEVLYQRYNHAHSFSSERIFRTHSNRNLMVRLARERAKYGRELSDWKEEEKRLHKKFPLLDDNEKKRYANYFEARMLLCAGKTIEARRLLSTVKGDLGNVRNVRIAILLSYLPGFLIGFILRWRDKIKGKLYYRRKISV